MLMKLQWESNSRFDGKGNIHLNYDPEIKSTFKSRADIKFLTDEERIKSSKEGCEAIGVMCVQIFLRTTKEVDCTQTRMKINRELPCVLKGYMLPNCGKLITVLPQKSVKGIFNSEVQIYCKIREVPDTETMETLYNFINNAKFK